MIVLVGATGAGKGSVVTLLLRITECLRDRIVVADTAHISYILIAVRRKEQYAVTVVTPNQNLIAGLKVPEPLEHGWYIR